MDVPAELGAVSCQLLLLSASSRARELCGSLEAAPTPLMVWFFRIEGSGVQGLGVPASVVSVMPLRYGSGLLAIALSGALKQAGPSSFECCKWHTDM